MTRFEYKVIPAPRRGEKSRAAKTTPDRFALTLTSLMNGMAQQGWEYLRADTLPCEERSGLTGTATHFQAMLVFRRPLSAVADQPEQPRDTPTPNLLAETLQPVAVVVPALSIDAPSGAAPALGPAQVFKRG